MNIGEKLRLIADKSTTEPPKCRMLESQCFIRNPEKTVNRLLEAANFGYYMFNFYIDDSSIAQLSFQELMKFNEFLVNNFKQFKSQRCENTLSYSISVYW